MLLEVSYDEVACVDEVEVANRKESGMTRTRLRLARHDQARDSKTVL
jgi:hypothetical protein